jgi:protein SCO1/2
MLFAVLVGGSATGVAASKPPPFVGPTLKHPAPPPDFALRDQRGRVVRLTDQRGKVVLITFLYTHCPDFCPLTAERLNVALRSLGPSRKDVVVLAVSVDPKGDTPAAVDAFVRKHHLVSQFHYLTGTAASLRRVWRAYKVSAVKPHGPDVDHTLYTLVVDRRGKARVLFDALAKSPAVEHDVRLLLRAPTTS